MAHIMEDMKKGKQIEGKRMKVAPLDMTRILPKLNEFLKPMNWAKEVLLM